MDDLFSKGPFPGCTQPGSFYRHKSKAGKILPRDTAQLRQMRRSGWVSLSEHEAVSGFWAANLSELTAQHPLLHGHVQ